LVYRPDYYGIFYDINLSTDIVINNIQANVTWIPQTAPLVLDGNDLPVTVRGFLSNDGFLQREVVSNINEEGVTFIGGPNVTITMPDGPYVVGVDYPMSISYTPTNQQGWSNSAGSAIVGGINGSEMSSLHVFFDNNRQQITNINFDFEGYTEIGAFIDDAISLVFLVSGLQYHGEELIVFILDQIADFLAETAAHGMASGILSYFEPTQNIDFVDHTANNSVKAETPAYFGLIMGDGTGGLNDIARVSSFNLTYNIKFNEVGAHEIVIIPNLMTAVKYTFFNNLITSDINTFFEYKDDISIHFDVIDPNTAPILSTPHITPSNSGDTATNFSYQITYSDNENDAPSSASVIVDSSTFPMTTSDFYYKDGSLFTSSPRTFGTGVHSYYYSFTQGTNIITTTPLNFYVYPSVNGHDLKLTTLSVNRSYAEQGDTISIDGQINNTGTYTENSISVVITVTGPGSYSWTNSKNIGNLTPGGIWGNANIANWSIPGGALDGEYLIQVTVNTPGGDQNWSDNSQAKGLYVSDEGPLIYMTYQYQFKQLNWTWTCTAPGFETWGCYGPGTVSNPGGDIYNVWVTDTGSEWSIFVRNTTDGTNLVDFYDDAIPRYEVYYEDNHNLLYSSPSVVVNENYVWIKLGYPQPGASISPPIQSSAVGVKAAYSIYVPCSTCGYSNPYVYTASGGDDPPTEFFNTSWPGAYDKSGSGPTFTLNLAPSVAGVKKFAFDTRKQDTTSQNFIVFGKIEGYVPVDNAPFVRIDSPVVNQVIFGTQAINVTATDDKGINRVEFYVDGVLKYSDTLSPYSYAWDTTTIGDGSHTITTMAYDTKPQSSFQSAIVSVDNNPPTISGIGHSPTNPSSNDPVTVNATITDTSGVSTAVLKYSHDGGSNWVVLTMTNQGSNIWQTIIPAMDKDDVLYKIETTDAFTRTQISSNASYHVSDETPPTFYSWMQIPSNLTEDYTGTYRITVRLKDFGGSGLSVSPPGFDYRIGAGSYNGFVSMASSGEDGWHFDIPSRDWDSLRGQTLYYKTQAVDLDGNVSLVERSEIIDSINDAPIISSSNPVESAVDIDQGACQDFQITTSDAEDDPLTYSWVVDNIQRSTGQTYQFCVLSGDEDEHSIVVVVSDASLQTIRSWVVNQNQLRIKLFLPLMIKPVSSSQPGSFNKSLPADTSIDQSTNLILDWFDSSNVTKYYYCYDKINDGECNDIWRDTGTTSNASAYGLDAGATYFWQVKAINSNPTPTYADNGAWWSFTTQAVVPPPGSFIKLWPGDEYTDQPLNPSLQWSTSSGATGYEYCIDSTINDTCNDDWITVVPFATSIVVDLSANTIYEWQIKARNSNPTSTYADGGTWVTFTTQSSSTSLYSYFPFNDKNDSLGYAITGQAGSITYQAGKSGNALSIPADASSTMLYFGSSIDDPDDTYRDFMYETQTLNVWINISEFNALTEPTMVIISGQPHEFPDNGGCVGAINHWSLNISNVGGCSDGCPPATLPRIELSVLSYASDGSRLPAGDVKILALQDQLMLNQWYMITVTNNVETNTWTMYINGQYYASTTPVEPVGPGALTRACPYAVGNRPNSMYPSTPFAGKIDELKFWHGVLSASQIQQLYDSYMGSPIIAPRIIGSDIIDLSSIFGFPRLAFFHH